MSNESWPELIVAIAALALAIAALVDIAHTYSACQPVLDDDTRLLSLRINDKDYAEVTDVERIMA